MCVWLVKPDRKFNYKFSWKPLDFQLWKIKKKKWGEEDEGGVGGVCEKRERKVVRLCNSQMQLVVCALLQNNCRESLVARWSKQTFRGLHNVPLTPPTGSSYPHDASLANCSNDGRPCSTTHTHTHTHTDTHTHMAWLAQSQQAIQHLRFPMHSKLVFDVWLLAMMNRLALLFDLVSTCAAAALRIESCNVELCVPPPLPTPPPALPCSHCICCNPLMLCCCF